VPEGLAAAALAGGLSSDQEKSYNTAISGLALETAFALNGGYKPDQGTIQKLEDTHRVTGNDTGFTAAYKLADVVAKLKSALEVTPAYTEEQKINRVKLLECLEQYETPENILAKERGEMRESPTQKPANAPPDAQRAPDGHWYSKGQDGKYIRWD
jgi:hypothetical protein